MEPKGASVKLKAVLKYGLYVLCGKTIVGESYVTSDIVDEHAKL